MPPFNANEGQLLTNIPIATFFDLNPNATADDFTGLIDWGDGTPFDVPVFTYVGNFAGASLWLVTGSHTYTSPAGSPYTVSVGVQDKDTSGLPPIPNTPDAQLTLTNTATVIQAPLAVQATSINGTAGSPTIPGGFAIAEFSDNAVPTRSATTARASSGATARSTISSPA